jgi:hypothetical protein
VFTDFGYTHPSPSAWPFGPVPVEANSLNVMQSDCVCGLGACPLICAM